MNLSNFCSNLSNFMPKVSNFSHFGCAILYDVEDYTKYIALVVPAGFPVGTIFVWANLIL